MNPIGIERLVVFAMPPIAHVKLAAALGCGAVGIGFEPMAGFDPDGFGPWSLRDDRALRRDLVTAAADHGVRLGLVEGFVVAIGREPADAAADLDIVAELGAERINVVSMDKDFARTVDGFATIAALAAERGLLCSSEVGSMGPIGKLEDALEAARQVNAANFSLLIDTMHFFRLGNTVERFAALDPALIGYVQLCDVPWRGGYPTYLEEALHHRLPPGEGELPLADFLAHVPDGVIVSLEVPQRSLAEQGVGPRERAARCVAATRALMRD